MNQFEFPHHHRRLGPKCVPTSCALKEGFAERNYFAKLLLRNTRLKCLQVYFTLRMILLQ